VGVSHIENLGSREGILKAKCEIFSGMKKDGLKILNGDDDMLSTVKTDNCCFFSFKEGSEIYASDVKPHGFKGIGCVIHTPKGSFAVEIPVPGTHMVSNAMAATAVGLHFGLELDEIKSGIEGFKPTAMRMDIIKTDRFEIINDVYNANPNSVKAAIDVLKYADGFKCAILGDMLELGDFSADMHLEVGKYAAGLDLVIAVGEFAEYIAEGAGKNAVYFSDMDSFLTALDVNDPIPDGASILVKASRGMHFEKITKALTEQSAD
jgi:UDP-N-acetylmuramoyl-tripeptide--D-alanyl-D-alanine ligase